MSASHPLGVRELKLNHLREVNPSARSHPLGVRELKPQVDGQGNSSRSKSHPLGVRELKPARVGVGVDARSRTL